MLPAKIGVGIAGLTMLATAGLAPVAMAHGSEFSEEISAWRDSVKEAVTNGDYDSWSSLLHDRNQERFDEAEARINEENFALHQELAEAIQNGDTERAQELREELGIRPHHRHHGPLARNSEEFKEVLSNNDYDGWVALMETLPEGFQENVGVNEETYTHMLEVHNLAESGDKEGAMELQREWREAHKE